MSTSHTAEWQCKHCMKELPYVPDTCPFCQQDVKDKFPSCGVCGMLYRSTDQQACQCVPTEETVPSHSTGQSGDSVCKIEQAVVIDKQPDFSPCSRSIAGPSDNWTNTNPSPTLPPNIKDIDSEFGSQEIGGQEGRDSALHEDSQQSNGQKKMFIPQTPPVQDLPPPPDQLSVSQ